MWLVRKKLSMNFSVMMMIIIIIILVITSMHGIYNYVPETNRISRVCSVAAVLYLQFALHVMIFRPWNVFCTFTSALPVVSVQCTIRLFLYFLISCSPVMLHRYCMSDFEMIPVATIITGITFVFKFQVLLLLLLLISRCRIIWKTHVIMLYKRRYLKLKNSVPSIWFLQYSQKPQNSKSFSENTQQHTHFSKINLTAFQRKKSECGLWIKISSDRDGDRHNESDVKCENLIVFRNLGQTSNRNVT
jgi:hypothetical protein